MGHHFGDIIPFMGILFGGAILSIAAIGTCIVIIIRTIKGKPPLKNGQSQADEAMMIQEIYQGLTEMEKRVEALETIILETSRKDRQS